MESVLETLANGQHGNNQQPLIRVRSQRRWCSIYYLNNKNKKAEVCLVKGQHVRLLLSVLLILSRIDSSHSNGALHRCARPTQCCRSPGLQSQVLIELSTGSRLAVNDLSDSQIEILNRNYAIDIWPKFSPKSSTLSDKSRLLCAGE